MKINAFRNKTKKVALFLVVGILAIGVLAFLPVNTVHAQDIGNPSTEPTRPVRDYTLLKQAYQRVQGALGNLENAISKASGGDGKVQDLINKGNEAGLDISSLQAALSSFDPAAAEAQASCTDASRILSSHAGFDSAGNVTDPAAARQTVQGAATALKEGASALKGAGSSLAASVRAWAEANKGTVGSEKMKSVYQKEQDALGKLNGYLSKTGDASTRVQALIDKGNAAGVDTSTLSAALTSFQTSVATAQSFHDHAATLLGTHAGFDEQGNVTDSTAAKQTLQEAASSLKTAGSTLGAAADALKTAATAWLDANKGILDGKLREGLQSANDWLSVQATNISKLQDASTELSAFIDKARSKGMDTSNLEAVLGDLNSQIPCSQSNHGTASSILTTHPGFDDSGKVIDEGTAKQTLESAKTSLDASRSINVSLANELKAAIDAWKSVHPGSTETPSIETGEISG